MVEHAQFMATRFSEGHLDWVTTMQERSPPIYCDYLLRNTLHGVKYFTNRIRSGSKCLIVHQG